GDSQAGTREPRRQREARVQDPPAVLDPGAVRPRGNRGGAQRAGNDVRHRQRDGGGQRAERDAARVQRGVNGGDHREGVGESALRSTIIPAVPLIRRPPWSFASPGESFGRGRGASSSVLTGRMYSRRARASKGCAVGGSPRMRKTRIRGSR